MTNQRKHIECFVARLLAELPYQTVKDAAVQAAFDKSCELPDELRGPVGHVCWWLLEHEPFPLPADYRFCEPPGSNKLS